MDEKIRCDKLTVGEVTIQVGTFRKINGLIVKILDENNEQLYITP